MPPVPPAADEGQDHLEMPFLDHLEELRWRILKALGAIVVGAVVCFLFTGRLLQILTYPYEEAVLSLENGRAPGAVGAMQQLLEQWFTTSGTAPADSLPQIRQVPPNRRLQSLKPTTYLMVSMEVGLWGGLILALPVVFYQMWLFVAPGLFRNERRVVLPVVAMSVVCFAIGALVAYWLVLPLGLRFFLALEPPGMTSQWAVDQYISFVVRLLLGFGLVFEMPVLSFLLSRIGLITPQLLRRVRRYSIVIIFIVAAVLTPPDPLSQVLLALPLLLLYEVSIWISSISRPRRA
jgi:sec-independent protein translocase protein TatC